MTQLSISFQKSLFFLSDPTDMQTLKSFYKSVRPWGLWQPVYQELIKEDKSIKKNIIGNKYIACKFDNSNNNVSLSKESLN